MTDKFKRILAESKKKNEHRDCAVRAVAIATDYEYDDTHFVFETCGRRRRKGTPWGVTEKAVHLLRFRMIDVTDQFSSKTVCTLEREMRWRRDSYLVRVSRHVLAVKGGRVHDWTQGRRHRIISIYKLVEVSEEFHRADQRNIVHLVDDTPDGAEDVSALYRQTNNRWQVNCKKIVLTKDVEGPVFKGVRYTCTRKEQ